MAAKAEVEAFLAEANALISQGRRFLVPRESNLQGLFDLDLTEADAWPIIARLTANNYCKGPEADDDGTPTFVWVFGASVTKTLVYIKLKIDEGKGGRRLKCLSFHPSAYEMRFPLRPVRGEK